MKRSLILLGLGLLVISSGCALTRSCGDTLHCSSCGKACHAEVKETESTHNCYSEECKDICIPAIRFPWEDCCSPLRCGKVRSVKVLKKYEYKCPDCEVEWSVVGCAPQGCQHGGKDAGNADAPTPRSPQPEADQEASTPARPSSPMSLQPAPLQPMSLHPMSLQPVHYYAPAS